MFGRNYAHARIDRNIYDIDLEKQIAYIGRIYKMFKCFENIFIVLTSVLKCDINILKELKTILLFRAECSFSFTHVTHI